MSNGKAKPAVPQTPTCRLGQRCHISGQGIKTFGSKFSRAQVRDLASSSVQLVANSPPVRIASGVLIAPQVVLCAAHTLEQGIGNKLELMLHFECDDKTAPPGAFFQYARAGRAWPACTQLATAPQAAEVKVLEIERSSNLDYAMVLIKWTSAPGNVVKLPRVPKIPKPGRTFTQEMVLIGHPQDSSKQGEPAQASAFRLLQDRGPNPSTGTGDTYVYGEFGFTTGEGFSGGGVFNDKGELVGILKGSPGETLASRGLHSFHFAFLDLGLASDHTMNDPNRGRLKLWFNTGNPLKPTDGAGPDPTFQ